jgi:hypothetical protein
MYTRAFVQNKSNNSSAYASISILNCDLFIFESNDGPIVHHAIRQSVFKTRFAIAHQFVWFNALNVDRTNVITLRIMPLGVWRSDSDLNRVHDDLIQDMSDINNNYFDRHIYLMY